MLGESYFSLFNTQSLEVLKASLGKQEKEALDLRKKADDARVDAALWDYGFKNKQIEGAATIYELGVLDRAMDERFFSTERSED